MLQLSVRSLVRRLAVERVGWFAMGLSAAGVGLVAYQVLLGSASASSAIPPPRQQLPQLPFDPATPTPRPGPSPFSTPTPWPTHTPRSTATPHPSATPRPTFGPWPTSTPRLTATPRVAFAPRPTFEPRLTSTPRPSATPRLTATPRPTFGPWPTSTPRATATPRPFGVLPAALATLVTEATARDTTSAKAAATAVGGIHPGQ